MSVFRDKFLELDLDGDGSLSQAEYEKCLKELGVNVATEDVRSYFNEADTDCDGSINFNEFATVMLKIYRYVFSYCDTTGNGDLSAEQTRKALGALGSFLNDEVFDKWFKKSDRDGNGRISFDEFLGL